MADLFSDYEKRERQAALRRREPRPHVSLRRRFDAFAIAAVGSVAIPGASVFALDQFRRLIGPRDAEVLLWWPELAAFSLAGVAVGVIAAFVLGGTAFVAGHWWPLVRRPWIALAIAGMLFPLVSLNSSISIYAEKAVVTGSVRHKSGTLRLQDAAWVEVWCSGTGGRGSIPTIGYALQFRGGARLDLTEARWPSQRKAVREWFRTVERLDQGALKGVEHRPLLAASGGPLPNVHCMRRLRNELDEKDFVAARRMLGVSDRDFVRLYGEPHEAWRSDANGASAVEGHTRP